MATLKSVDPLAGRLVKETTDPIDQLKPSLITLGLKFGRPVLRPRPYRLTCEHQTALTRIPFDMHSTPGGRRYD
ncbi:MAG: hypothetical protein M3072_02785 [Candidatus Dormibacteraeota bacterium]|nr:hypothetical protein [Candidatus Dormibacteraeota bacterium]